jgi:hypothetical protein
MFMKQIHRPRKKPTTIGGNCDRIVIFPSGLWENPRISGITPDEILAARLRYLGYL